MFITTDRTFRSSEPYKTGRHSFMDKHSHLLPFMSAKFSPILPSARHHLRNAPITKPGHRLQNILQFVHKENTTGDPSSR